MTEGAIVEWLKQPGDAVAVGDVLVEIETDKSTVELEAEAEGVLHEILLPAGERADVGAVIAIIRGGGDVVHDGDANSSTRRSAEPTVDLEASSPEPDDPTTPTIAAASSDGGKERRLSPRQRAQQSTAPAGEDPADSFRNAVAESVVASWTTIPHFSVVREMAVDVSVAQRLSEKSDVRVTFTDVLLMAISGALEQTIGAGAGAELGLAVETSRGVAIPVVSVGDCADARQVAQARHSAVSRAKEGKLLAVDFTAKPLATLSNLGTHGVDLFSGIIPAGQKMIFCVGTARKRSEDHPTMFVTLVSDHRTVDGADAARILEAMSASLSEALQ